LRRRLLERKNSKGAGHGLHALHAASDDKAKAASRLWPMMASCN
jgi:hypothetical protein